MKAARPMGKGHRRPSTGWVAACLVGCLLSGLVSRFARAEVPHEWLGMRVDEVSVVGEAEGRVSPRDVGVPVGVPLTRGLIRQAVRGLSDTGLYRDVQIDARRTGRGVELLVRLTPRFVAMRIDVVGNDHLPRRELVRTLGLKEDGEVEREELSEAGQRVEAHYADLGFRDSQVRVVMRDTDDPILKVLHVQVDEGPETLIEGYVFAGDPLPKRKGLRRTLSLNKGERLDVEQVSVTLSEVEHKLHEAGYYEAKFGEVELQFKDQGAIIRVESHVGPHYRIAIAGQEPLLRGEIFDELDLTETALSADGPFGALEARVVDLYRKLGYPDARVTVERRAPSKAVCEGDCDRVDRTVSLRPTLREPQLRGDAHTDAVILVDIVKGAQLDVHEVRFVGAQHFDQDFLREQLFSYLNEDLPASVIGQPVDPYLADALGYGGDREERERVGEEPPIADPRRLYYRQTYEQAAHHIRDLYRGDGYLSVEISGPELTPTGKDDNQADAVFTIAEGPRTYLHDVQLTGNVQVTTYDLLASIELQAGQPFSFLLLEQARLRALTAYRERGFIYATVEPVVRFSNDGTRAEVVFELVERFVVRVGAIEVRGADRSRESMIRNRVTLRPGDLYRPSEARRTEEQLLSLDVFTSVAVAPEEADLPARVKTVVVTVTERRTQWLGWSGGFSTGEGARGGIEYGYRNLFGSAVRASLRGQIGYQLVFLDEEIRKNYAGLDASERIEYQLNAAIGTPYIPNAPRIGTSLDFVVLQDLQRDYRMQKEGVIASLYYRPIKRVVLTFAEEIERSYFQVFDQQGETLMNLPVSELVPFGGNSLFSSHVSAAWDLRDRAFNPTRGVLLSATTQWAHTLRDAQEQIPEAGGAPDKTVTFRSNMLRFTATGAFYVPLGSKLVFATQIRWGRVVHLEKDSQAYPNRRFYLGGLNFRGYRQYAMVPQDIQDQPGYDPSTTISTGGQTFIAAQNELRFPIFGQLYGGVFSDVGNLWDNPKSLDFRELEVTVGVGLRIQTPVAALAFDYGVRQLDFGPFEMKGAFQFAFQRF